MVETPGFNEVLLHSEHSRNAPGGHLNTRSAYIFFEANAPYIVTGNWACLEVED